MSMGSEEGDKHLQTEGVPSALGLIASHVVRIWDDDYDDVPKKNTQAKTAKKGSSAFNVCMAVAYMCASLLHGLQLSFDCMLAYNRAGRQAPPLHYILES